MKTRVADRAARIRVARQGGQSRVARGPGSRCKSRGLCDTEARAELLACSERRHAAETAAVRKRIRGSRPARPQWSPEADSTCIYKDADARGAGEIVVDYASKCWYGKLRQRRKRSWTFCPREEKSLDKRSRRRPPLQRETQVPILTAAKQPERSVRRFYKAHVAGDTPTRFKPGSGSEVKVEHS